MSSPPNKGSIANLLVLDGQGSVLYLAEPQVSPPISYTVYGADALTREQKPRLRFTGQILENTGIYLLGNGHRCYNPSLFCFTSPDRLSPFSSGGINCYAYAHRDPINLQDPSGMSPTTELIRKRLNSIPGINIEKNDPALQPLIKPEASRPHKHNNYGSTPEVIPSVAETAPPAAQLAPRTAQADHRTLSQLTLTELKNIKDPPSNIHVASLRYSLRMMNRYENTVDSYDTAEYVMGNPEKYFSGSNSGDLNSFMAYYRQGMRALATMSKEGHTVESILALIPTPENTRKKP